MKINHGYVRRLALTPAQTEVLDDQAHAARALWNLLHEWWQWGGRNRRPTLKQADEAIRQARKDIPWLAQVPAISAQQILKTYHRAWVNFFEGHTQPPQFKSRRRTRLAVDNPLACQFRVVRLNRRWAEFTVPLVGRVRFRWTGPIPGVGREPGRLTGARLVKDPPGWHVAFRTESVKPDPAPHPGPLVGIDRGISVALALSDGNDQEHGPWMKPKEQERLLRLERTAARKRRHHKRGTPTSKRLHRTYDQIAALRARAKRRRYDWQHKTTTGLAKRYGLVVVEDLKIRNMTASAKGTVEAPGRNVRQKAGLNRAMLNQAHGRTVCLLAYKLAERGGALVRVSAAGTSQTCSTCGHRDPASRKGIKFECAKCGWFGHADSNAALNILAAGLAVNGRGADAAGRGREASTTRRAA